MTPPPASAERRDCASDGPITPILARPMSERGRDPDPTGPERMQADLMIGWNGADAGAWGTGSAHQLGDPLVRRPAIRRANGLLDFAPVRKRRGDRRYSDLAIAAVEVRLIRAGACPGLARIV